MYLYLEMEGMKLEPGRLPLSQLNFQILIDLFNNTAYRSNYAAILLYLIPFTILLSHTWTKTILFLNKNNYVFNEK